MSDETNPDHGEPLEFIRRLVGAWDCCGTCAGGVLAQRDRAREAAAATRARAEALREAADQLDRDGMKRLGAHTVKQWLRARADSLAPDTPARTKPTTATLLADLAATREADQGAREKRALGGAS